jgi:hypothetical protein
MSLILRCVNISENPIKVEEHFVEFITVDDTTEECLFNVLINVIKKNLNLILMIYKDKDMMMDII